MAPPGTTLARVTALPEQYAMPDLPAFRHGGDGAIVLLTNSGEAEKIEALLTGALGELRYEKTLPEATPGAPQTLSDLSVGTLEGRGHYIDQSVSFRLPWDWLVLASQEARLRLDYAFAEDLPAGSLLLVKLNGETVRLLPLDDPAQAGRRLDPLPIPFAASKLQPGVNELSFEALVPGEPADAACAPRSEPVFQVFDTTRLDVPASPSMTLPRIDRTLASLDVSRISMSEAAQRSLPIGLLPQIASIYAPDERGAAAQNGLPRIGSIRIGIPADLSSIPGDIVSKNVSMLEEVLLSAPGAHRTGPGPLGHRRSARLVAGLRRPPRGHRPAARAEGQDRLALARPRIRSRQLAAGPLRRGDADPAEHGDPRRPVAGGAPQHRLRATGCLVGGHA